MVVPKTFEAVFEDPTKMPVDDDDKVSPTFKKHLEDIPGKQSSLELQKA
jgi:hypothetical protein